MSRFFSRLVFELTKLPGIGERSAQRLAAAILRKDTESARQLASAIVEAKEAIRLCRDCFLYTETFVCSVCSDRTRQGKLLCVVEHPNDYEHIEKTGAFKGYYHCLHGHISPADGIGPESLKLEELWQRLQQERDAPIEECLLALNPTVEGEATSWYIAEQLRPMGIRVTALASGLSAGSLLMYADKESLNRAISNRVELR
jgi:recombination protein RecR